MTRLYPAAEAGFSPGPKRHGSASLKPCPDTNPIGRRQRAWHQQEPSCRLRELWRGDDHDETEALPSTREGREATSPAGCPKTFRQAAVPFCFVSGHGLSEAQVCRLKT